MTTPGGTASGWSAPTTVRTVRLRVRRRVAGAAVTGVVAVLAVAALSTGGDTPVPARPLEARAGQVVLAAAAPTGVAPTGHASVDGLQPAVARSIRRAIAAAAADGVSLAVTSGWRSADEQAALHADAIRTYGSAQAARQWVLPPGESEHVRGGAVDVGPPAAAAWLARRGVRFGLCQRYDNEPWHFERLAGAKGSRCPGRQVHA